MPYEIKQFGVKERPKIKGVLNHNGEAYLDLVRASAASLVLVTHTSMIFEWTHPVDPGPLGVGLFFLLSGFLIFQSCWKRMQGPTPYFAPYMVDRFARIFTVYIPALIFVALSNAVLVLSNRAPEGVATGAYAFFGNLLLLEDYPVFQAVSKVFGSHAYHIRPYNTAGPFWTIPIEFWIYVWFGLVFFYGLMREHINRWIPLFLFLISTPVIIWNVSGGAGNGLAIVWFLGALVSYLWVNLWVKAAHKAQIGGFLITMGTICLLARIGKIGPNFQDIGIVVCVTTILFGGLSLVEGCAPMPKVLRAACGLFASYSYSLYLVHNTVLIILREHVLAKTGWLQSGIAFITAHLVAILFYVLFERHYRAIGKLIKRKLLPRTSAVEAD